MYTKSFFEADTFERFLGAGTIPDHAHANPFFELLFVTNGGGILQIDMQRFELQAGYVYCIMPSQLHRLQPAASTAGYVIRFNEAVFHSESKEFNSLFYTNLLQAIGRSASIAFDKDVYREMIHIVTQLMREHNRLEAYQSEMLMQYLNILFIYMGRQCREEAEATVYNCNLRLLKRFISLVDKHFKTNKRVSEYADLMLVTPNHLNHAIKSASGHTAGYYIRQRIILEAKRQAVYSDSSMKEVAWELGFPDISHFSKLFKKETGNNFTEFKRERISTALMVV